MYIDQAICNYYQERQNKSKLFKGLNIQKVSIHEVININTQRKDTKFVKKYSLNNQERKILKDNKFYMMRKNDISLLKSVLITSKEKKFKLLKFMNTIIFSCSAKDRRIYNFRKWIEKIKKNSN